MFVDENQWASGKCLTLPILANFPLQRFHLQLLPPAMLREWNKLSCVKKLTRGIYKKEMVGEGRVKPITNTIPPF